MYNSDRFGRSGLKSAGGMQTRSPLVDSVLGVLAKRFQDGTYRAGQRLPTERTLAQELGVSRVVVRTAVRALAERGLVRLADRCRPVVVRAGGGPDGRVATAQRHTLALWLTHKPTEAEMPSLLFGIQRRLDHDSFRLIVDNASGDTPESVTESEAQFLWHLAEDQDIAGAMLWYSGATGNIPALGIARSAGIPLVFIDRRSPVGFEADHVGVDNAAAAEIAVRHLVGKGHRRIAHVTNSDPVSTVSERKAGYRAALEAAGIRYDEKLVFRAAGRYSDMAATCRALAHSILDLAERPTAFFCVNDRLAFNMIDALGLKGLRVPEDASVVGFDGIERWMPGPSSLTTCLQPFEQLGSTAVDLLLRRIERGPEAAYRHVLLDAPLSVCASTSTRNRTDPSEKH